MTNQEAADIIRRALAEIEWEQPMQYAAAIDKAIEALEGKDKDVPTKWISVKDRLPEYEGDYLVTDGHKPPWKCRLMILAGIKGWSNDALKPAVKYWMPLPEPPKGGENE